jgi:hypothetical protein
MHSQRHSRVTASNVRQSPLSFQGRLAEAANLIITIIYCYAIPACFAASADLI